MALAPVFGAPITDEVLIATGKYKVPITQKQRGDYAMSMQNEGGKRDDAEKYVKNLKERYGNGISAKCFIYNGTGTTLKYVTTHNWHGHFEDDAVLPTEIDNGQWGAYLHVHSSSAMVGSAGAIVYRTGVLGNDTISCDWLFSWSIPFFGSNRVYTEIRDKGHFPDQWDVIYNDRLENSNGNSNNSDYGYFSSTTIGQGDTADVRATFHVR